ncbi:MAG TPA: hypothetical protein VJ505_07885 [Holophagaceae bacterium]|nr:hypothetical protein [Holophagaceae bacterium]
MEGRRRREPDSRDTAEFAYEEILERLELGRLIIQATEQGSRLATVHNATPEADRRGSEAAGNHPERRSFIPIDLPTRFPESGPIHLLLVGGFADDAALRRPVPYWEDDQGGASLVWQALYRSGLIHPDDRDFAMGQGGFWDDRPPRTQDLALTYSGYRRRHEIADIDRVLHPWNQQRLQTLALACHERSGGRLRIIALGDVARHLMCTAAYGVPGIAVLSLPEPNAEELAEMHTQGPAAEKWVDWAASLLAVGRG